MTSEPFGPGIFRDRGFTGWSYSPVCCSQTSMTGDRTVVVLLDSFALLRGCTVFRVNSVLRGCSRSFFGGCRRSVTRGCRRSRGCRIVFSRMFITSRRSRGCRCRRSVTRGCRRSVFGGCRRSVSRGCSRSRGCRRSVSRAWRRCYEIRVGAFQSRADIGLSSVCCVFTFFSGFFLGWRFEFLHSGDRLAIFVDWCRGVQCVQQWCAAEVVQQGLYIRGCATYRNNVVIE